MSNDLFCIKPISSEAGFDAIRLISGYGLNFVVSNYVHRLSPGVITVYSDGTDNFRQAEMTFQMNYRQVGMVCPICSDNGEDVCGHLTFSGRINSAF